MIRALFLLFAVLTGCGGFECDEETPCNFGETCVDGTCRESACATSAQCPIETYCAPSRRCEPGCEADADCQAGYRCNNSTTPGTCEQKPCESSHVDCGFREFCNQGTGECYDAGGQYCKPCEPESVTTDCGADGICYGGYCAPDCAGGRECPSGFDCVPFVNDAQQIVAWRCFTYCWLYEDYDPGSFVLPPQGGGPAPDGATPSAPIYPHSPLIGRGAP